jgi:heme exporter protein A
MLEVVDLLYVHGPNGSGKTTLLRTLCGLSMPEAGDIRWRGQNIRQLGEEFHKEMAYVGHLNGVKDELTAFENLQVAGQLAGVVASDERAMAALQRMELTACGELPGKVLSQGQKRRVALARLLLAPMALWIMDEPFNALDVKAVGMIQAVLSEHLDNGGMVVLTTHQDV